MKVDCRKRLVIVFILLDHNLSLLKDGDNGGFVVVRMTVIPYPLSQLVSTGVPAACVRAEGYDPLVLDGAIPVLAGSGVRVFMFEYHGIGVWKDANVRLKVCCVETVPRISHTPSLTHLE